MHTPEELARENIDKQLGAFGWMVQWRSEMKWYDGHRAVVAESAR